MADYKITGDGTNYYGYQGTNPTPITSGTNPTAVINYVYNLMSTGQTVDFIGSFTITTRCSDIKKSIIMDFTQATVTVTGTFFWIYNPVNLVGGHFIGLGTDSGLLIVNATNTIFDNSDFQNFLVGTAYASSYTEFLRCVFHDSTNMNLLLFTSDGGGHHKAIGCTFRDANDSIYVSAGHPYCQFLNCKFIRLNGHGMYLDGVDGLGGHIVAGCEWDAQSWQGGIHCKCKNNIIGPATVDGISYPGNNFHDFPAGNNAVAISIYSEYESSTANDNEIFGNTFTNLDMAIWLGHDAQMSPMARTKIHDNVFTNVRRHCFGLNPWIAGGAWNYVDDTKIYYNDFHNCPTPFKASDGPASWIRNLVIAHNTFDPPVPPDEVAVLKSYVNTMIYGNIGLEDFNPVTDPTSPYYIPPRIAPTPQLIVTVTANPTAIQANGSSTVTVHVVDDSSNNIINATVALIASGGTLTAISGITDSAGNFTTSFTDNVEETVTINAIATASDYTAGQTTVPATITVSTTPPILATVAGIVSDGTNPIAGATVTLDGNNRTTGNDGAYSFDNVEAKVYQMTVTASGYQTWTYPLDARAGGTITQNVTIAISPIPSDNSALILIGLAALAVILGG